jgi:hypothetical protein
MCCKGGTCCHTNHRRKKTNKKVGAWQTSGSSIKPTGTTSADLA